MDGADVSRPPFYNVFNSERVDLLTVVKSRGERSLKGVISNRRPREKMGLDFPLGYEFESRYRSK